MNIIVIDLEFTAVPSKFKEFRKTCHNETIEIGAVKLDETKQIVDRFDMYVKPLMATVSPEVQNLTGIVEADLAGAPSFEEAMDRFTAWMGEDEAEIYSWSTADFYQIKREAEAKGYENPALERMYASWHDLQAEYCRKIGFGQKLSLANALRSADIPFVGKEHSAADDAENTASIYLFMINDEAFKMKMQAVLELLAPSEPLTCSLGSFFPAELLKNDGEKAC